MIVVDASVVVTALADDGPDGDGARDRLRGERMMAPHLIDVEVLAAWRRLTAAGDLDPAAPRAMLVASLEPDDVRRRLRRARRADRERPAHR